MAAIKPGSCLTVNRSRAFQSLLAARNEWYIKRSDVLEQYCHGYRMLSAISFLNTPKRSCDTQKRDGGKPRSVRRILPSVIQRLIAAIKTLRKTLKDRFNSRAHFSRSIYRCAFDTYRAAGGNWLVIGIAFAGVKCELRSCLLWY